MSRRKSSYEIGIPLIVKELRNGPKRFSELECCGIPKKSLQRYLNCLKNAGVIIKCNDERYYLAEHGKPVEKMTETELRARIEHSEMIIIGGLQLYIKDISLETKLRRTLIAYGSLSNKCQKKYIPNHNLKSYLEDHLKTGYPDIFEMIQVIRQKPEQSKIDELDELLENIIYSLISGEPLRGGCKTCPAIRLKSRKRCSRFT